MSGMNFASTPYIDPEPGALVQRFSWKLENSPPAESGSEQFQQLREDLIREHRRDGASKRLQDERRRIEAQFTAIRSTDEQKLSHIQQQLTEAMKNFQKLIPEGSKAKAFTNWGDVELAVEEVQSQWDHKVKETNVGRTKQWLRRMCDGMNNHSSALKMLPSESVYTSLVAGSVTMIIKASANHILITEAFAQGVVAINDAVDMIQKCVVYRTPVIEQLVMRLYTEIFSYLTTFMKWFTDRSHTRFLRSFNENLNRQFKDDLDRVKEVANLLNRQIQLHVSADVRSSKLLAEEINGDLRYLVKLAESSQRQPRIREDAQEKVMEKLLHSQFAESRKELLRDLADEIPNMILQVISGGGIRSLLEQQAEPEIMQCLMLTDSPETYTHSRNLSAATSSFSDNARASPCPTQSGETIKLGSRQYEDYFVWNRVFPFSEPLPPTHADSTFVMRLQTFTASTDSQVMYAHSRLLGTGPNYLQNAIASYINLVRTGGVPVISYFCQLSSKEPPENRTKQSIELSALVYSLIRQLVNLLPAELDESSPSFDQRRLQKLDGTLRTWDDALSLLVDLADAVRLPILLFVIDGLSWLEDNTEHSTTGKINQLIRCFMNIVQMSSKNDRLVKVVFTTVGLSGPLCEEVDPRDVVSCDPTLPDGYDGHRRSRQMIA